ncbi:hypothetical protein AGMMS49960_20240 [Betaproteobacteria bacterium]|nr:hypothetical protein AGMMS49543_16390 [Betaproteobacteria bacterium]GHU04488.1 hypothetical protein AGMMS49960_20240 [Betaproteobacteria bacterium]GHU24239.1 hypothetical protein AGMMS50243_27070 [Betaproteobacteria bacterium]
MTKPKPGRPPTVVASIVNAVPAALKPWLPDDFLRAAVAQMDATLRWNRLTSPYEAWPPALDLAEQKAALADMYDEWFLPKLEDLGWFSPAEGYYLHRAALLAAFAASRAAVQVLEEELPEFLNGVAPWDARLAEMTGNPEVPVERQTLAVAREVVDTLRKHMEECAADPDGPYVHALRKVSLYYGEAGARLLAGLFALGARRFFEAYAAGKIERSKLTKKQRQRADAAIASLREDAQQDEAES